MTEPNRRVTDPILFEMHGMLSALSQQLADHTKQEDKLFEAQHKLNDETDARIRPLEILGSNLGTLWKFLLIFITPSVLGLGAGIWYGFRYLATYVLDHSKIP